MNARLKSSAEVADRTVDRAQQAIGIVGSGRATAEEAKKQWRDDNRERAVSRRKYRRFLAEKQAVEAATRKAEAEVWAAQEWSTIKRLTHRVDDPPDSIITLGQILAALRLELGVAAQIFEELR